jgi:hypothetical protein
MELKSNHQVSTFRLEAGVYGNVKADLKGIDFMSKESHFHESTT